MGEGLPENFLLIARAIRPHGVKGLLKIWSYAHSQQSFFDAGSIFLQCPDGEIREHRVLSISPHKKMFLLKLEGLDSLAEAERYRDVPIFIRKDVLKRESVDEYFWYELIGLSVYLKTGEYIGKIKSILPTKGNDNYVVDTGEREILIPAIHDIVKEVDLKNKKVTIAEMEGLLDLNEI